MKNFDLDYMQQNGEMKKTLSRKEYDEQMALKFKAMEQDRHEELSAKAKEEFAGKTEEEKQQTMNEITGEENVQKKPLTYELVNAVKQHKDITLYAIASTGLEVKEKRQAMRTAEGMKEKIIAKDEPTFFKAETYTYNGEKYIPKDSIALFMKASEEVVRRALEQAKNGGYDVFENAEFDLPAYLNGENVHSKEEASEMIGKYLTEHPGVTLYYGVFHENMLRENGYPISEEAIDLNQIMREQGTYGTASLPNCVNKIVGITNKEDKMELKSTSEKLIANVVCINQILSENMDHAPKFMVQEEALDKFSDPHKAALLEANEKVSIEVMSRRRRVNNMEQKREMLRNREGMPERRTLGGSEVPFARRRRAEVQAEAQNRTEEEKEISAADLRAMSPDILGQIDMAMKEQKDMAQKENIVNNNAAENDMQSFFESEPVKSKPVKAAGRKEDAPQKTADVLNAIPEHNISGLLQALETQNKLLAERNILSMKQNEIEQNKIAEMQKQTELMEQQAKNMEKMLALMDNLTKIYSERDVSRLKVEEPVKHEEARQQSMQRSNGQMQFVRRTPRQPIRTAQDARENKLGGSMSELISGIENPQAEDLDLTKGNVQKNFHRQKEDDELTNP